MRFPPSLLDEIRARLPVSRPVAAPEVTTLGVEIKGLWLVDFDNGSGYYCWQHPEPSLSHYHGYEDGFAGRMKIM